MTQVFHNLIKEMTLDRLKLKSCLLYKAGLICVEDAEDGLVGSQRKSGYYQCTPLQMFSILHL